MRRLLLSAIPLLVVCVLLDALFILIYLVA